MTRTDEPTSAALPLLKVRGLSVSFTGVHPVRAVRGASFTVYPGQTLAIVGESGCGKSVTALSLLRLIPSPPGVIEGGHAIFDSGARPPDAPSVDLLALPDREIRRVRGGEIAMIFQEPMTSLNPVVSVGEQIVEAVRLHRRAARAEAHEIAVDEMNHVGIHDAAARFSAYPHQFSGGMRQRVMIAMALACRPKLLIADEPTTALDVTIQAQILDLIASAKVQRGLGVVLITHDLGVVANHADVVCVMYAGRVVEYAATPALFQRPMHPYTRGLLACVPRLGRRSGRLVTVAEVVEDEDQFRRLGGSSRGLRAWWPKHEAPADAAPNGPDDDRTVLAEIDPGHWVNLWRTDAARADHATVRAPDLSDIRATAPEARCAS